MERPASETQAPSGACTHAGPVEISVVIPAYNRAATIARCIESALVQDFPSFEVVVADDGSSDATREIVAGFADPRVRLVARESNGGAAAARNSGVAAARGRYVAFLDSDDVFLPGKLATQHAALRTAGPAQRLSCTAFRIELLDQGQVIDWYHRPDAASFEGLFKGCSLGPGSTLMVERRVLDEIGPLDTTLSRFEDWDWLLRYVAAGGEILVLNTILTHIYNRRGRLSRDTWQAAERLIAKRDAAFPRAPARLRREADFSIWTQVAGTAFYARDYPLLARAVARAARAQPAELLRRVALFASGRNAQQAAEGANSGAKERCNPE
jgi:glycosyltransferase involved in cell wall biosynthesis